MLAAVAALAVIGGALVAAWTLPGGPVTATRAASGASPVLLPLPASASPALPASPSPSEAAPVAVRTPESEGELTAVSVSPTMRGTGRLVAVPGTQAAPGAGRVHRVRVEVEEGLPVDSRAVADFVLDTLNDPRSWGSGGAMTFARTAGRDADIRVVLASPVTSAQLCAPLITRGTLSCGVGNHAILTYYRWVFGTPDYGTDLLGYRRYLVNHEVGHVLGHGHELCPGRGRPAPVMMQQTKGLNGCAKNSWPYP